MHYSTKRRVALGMTTGGLLVTGLGMASAQADTTAIGSTAHSPGVGSGNSVQLPVNAPINVCGNQVDVIGILNSVTGTSCENGGGSGGATSASGSAKGSPGVGSGNLIQIPINAPVNICGNQLDVIGIGDKVHGNTCANGGGNSTTASGGAKGSPGVGAGNLLQVPINAPVNVCGNQLDVIGILNSVTGTSCENGGSSKGKPPHPHPHPTPTPSQSTPSTPPTSPAPSGPPSGCSCTPPPPPPTTPCPPSATETTATPGMPSAQPPTPSASATSTATATSTPTGPGHSNGGGSNGPNSGSSVNAPIEHGGVLAHTGTGALAVAPLGAGLLGGGVLLRRRFPNRSR